MNKEKITFYLPYEYSPVTWHKLSLPFVVSDGDEEKKYTVVIHYFNESQGIEKLQVSKFEIRGVKEEEDVEDDVEEAMVILHNQIRREMPNIEGLEEIVEQVGNRILTIFKEKNIFYR